MKARDLIALMAPLCLAGTAQGAGFALIEQNASGMGNAYAGAAAVAEDASTIFFNPAGLTRVEGSQLVMAAHVIAPSAKFSDGGSVLVANGNGGDAGVTALVPNFYYAMPLTPDVKFGVGVNAPFGLTTEYDGTWAGQLQAIKSDMKTININPTLAWRVNDRLSLGFGLDWQYIEAELTQAAGIGVNPPQAVMKGDDSSWGWNIGLLWDIDADTRLGLAHRSGVSHHLTGTLGVLSIYADVAMPNASSLSLMRRLTPRWELLVDVTKTGWSQFQKLEVVNQATNLPVSTVNESWRNSMRYSVGVNFRPGREWTWRFGLAYDETPVPDLTHRTPRIPDADRIWLAVGGQYRFSPKSALDFGYAHLFVNNASLVNTAPAPFTLRGTYNNKIDIVSVQYTHSF